jgi:5-methylcytosine-specific restriction endonuclease McrA
MATKRGDPRNQRKYKAIRLIVLARDQYTCYYCNSPAHTVDHVVPVSRSSEAEAYDPNNMVACCSRCNSKRGSRNQGVFLAQTATPYAFLSSLSPSMTETVHIDPNTGKMR